MTLPLASPRLPRRLLSRLLPGDVRDAIVGDLEEVFRRRVRGEGLFRARWWYWREAASFSARFAADAMPRGSVMSLRGDIREAVRTFVRRPLFTMAVVGSLAFGIGASTAIFTVLNALMLRPLPVRDPGSLFQVVHRGDAGVFDSSSQAFAEYVRANATTIAGALQADGSTLTVLADGTAESLEGQAVSREYFDLLGVDALIGGVIQPRAAGATERAAVISHRYWLRRFGGDPGVLGRAITVDRAPHTIVGVTRPQFFGLEVGRHADVTVLLDEPEERPFWQSKALVVRLRPGVRRETARLELDRLLQQFLDSGKVVSTRARTQAFRTIDLQAAAAGTSGLKDRYARPLAATFAIVSALLVLACANLAGLFLARTAARQRDFAVCLALGASRARLARQLLTESLLMSFAGGALGLVVAWWGAELLVGFLPDPGVTAGVRATPDAAVLLFAAIAAALTGAAVGAAPALLAGRADLRDALAAGGRTIVFAGRTFRVLVGVQVALSTALVIAALLLTTSLSRLMAEPLGFVADGVLMLTLDASGADLDEERLALLQRQALDRLRRLPGVRAATFATIPPLSGNEDGKPIAIPGVTFSAPDEGVLQVNTVGPEFFETFRVPILRGRGIDARDDRATPQVAVVSESMARFYFPGVDPIGRRMDVGRGRTGGQIEIVGVARDVRYRDLRTPAPRIVYVAAYQRGVEESPVFALRADGEAAELTRAALGEMRAAAPSLPATAVTTLAGERDRRLVNERLLATMSTCFGALALVLAAIGVYGVVAYSVTARTAEIGLRAALGASRAGLVWLVVRGALGLVVSAAVAGGLVAFATRSMLSTFLFGIAPAPPWAYSGALALLTMVGLGATIGPTLRALRIDPVDTLRRQ